MKKLLVGWLLLIISNCSPETVSAQADTTFIDSLENKNFLQLYAGRFARQINFIPSDKRGRHQQVTLSPNSSAFCGFILGYKKITLYGDVALPQTAKLSPQQTNVRAFSFFISHFKNKWGATGFFSYNKGLLMLEENTGMMYGSREDIRKITGGVHIYHIINEKKFSYIAANSQQMRQRKSAGSFIVVLTPSYRIIQSPQSIIPIEKSKYHLTGAMTLSQRLQFFSLQLKPGYAHNFVWKNGNYFFAPSIYAGTGADVHQLSQSNNTISGVNMNFGYRTKLTTGINNSRIYATVELLYDHTQSTVYKSVYKNAYAECTLNVGWRF